MSARLPPVFQAVSCAREPGTAAALSIPDDCVAAYFASGAAALAATLVAALRVARGRRDCAQPEVLVPAYTCPEVVSAALHAGVRPVLVDLEAERPWLSLAGVEAALTPQTVAIVAIDFLGIPERLPALRALADAAGAMLIEDCAQSYPEAGHLPLIGDARIHSFGRGKPVNLLGGGLVVARRSLQDHLPSGGVLPGGAGARWAFCAKALAFNTVTRPILYGLLERLPGLHVGETRFHPLRSLAGLPQAQWEVMATGVQRYQALAQQRRAWAATLDRHLEAAPGVGIVNLPRVCAGEWLPSLLRYPLLCADRAQRDAAFARLDARGLGASRFYQTILPEIAAIPRDALRLAAAADNARAFAARLLTLPVHALAADRLDEIAALVLGRPPVAG